MGKPQKHKPVSRPGVIGDGLHELSQEGQRILDDWKDNAVQMSNEWLAKVKEFDKRNLSIAQTELLNQFYHMEGYEWNNYTSKLQLKRNTLRAKKSAKRRNAWF